jgi:sodium/potassium-transporting ATPase subunit alpha
VCGPTNIFWANLTSFSLQLVFFAYGQIGMIQAASGFFVYFMVLQRYLKIYGLDGSDLPGTGFPWKRDNVPVLYGACDDWLMASGLADSETEVKAQRGYCGMPYDPSQAQTKSFVKINVPEFVEAEMNGGATVSKDLMISAIFNDEGDVIDSFSDWYMDCKEKVGSNCMWRTCTDDEIRYITQRDNVNAELTYACGLHYDQHWAYTNSVNDLVPFGTNQGDGGMLDEDTDPFPNYNLDWATRVECLRKAQTSYLFSIIVVQWADVIICKTRTMSVLTHGMGNMVLNAGLFEETALGLCICYVPFLQAPFGGGTVMISDLCWALPYSLFIWLYDEIRKALMRLCSNGLSGFNEAPTQGFLYDYTYW